MHSKRSPSKGIKPSCSPYQTLGAIALGFMATTVQAADNQLNNAKHDNTQQNAIGLNQVNYLKILGYASTAGIYARNGGTSVTSVGNATGKLSVYGTPAGGRILRAVLTDFKDKERDANNTPTSNVSDQTNTAIKYEWLSQSAELCNSSGISKITRPKALPQTTPTAGTVTNETDWCVIPDSETTISANNTTVPTYTLKQEDVFQNIAVQITYTDLNGNEEKYSEKVGTSICLRDYNFARSSCLNLPLIQDSFESR